MKKRFLLPAAAGILSALAFSLTARASTITTVRLDIGPYEGQELHAGDMISGRAPNTYDNLYFVADYQVGAGSGVVGQPYSYSIDVRPEEGSVFSDSCAVEVRGAFEVALESRSPERMQLKVKTYPFYVIKNVKGLEEDGNSWKWDRVDNADTYDVLIYYENEDGEELVAKKSTTSRKIDVSSYNTSSRQFLRITVRGRNTKERGQNYIASGMYVDEDGEVDEENADIGYSFRMLTARSNSIATSETTVKAANGESRGAGMGEAEEIGPDSSMGTDNNGTSSKYTQGVWSAGADGLWYFMNGSSKRKGWINPAEGEWYYLSPQDGSLQSGWQLVDGYWFFLNPIHDGSYGKLTIGWQNIKGKWYYLNPVYGNGMPYGAMFANGSTLDGYHVGTDGAWLGY